MTQYLALLVTGVAPDEVTSALQMQPSHTMISGACTRFGAVVREHSWRKIFVNDSLDICAHFESLLRQLKPRWRYLKELADLGEIEVQWVVELSAEHLPYGTISADSLSCLAEVRASLSIDIS